MHATNLISPQRKRRNSYLDLVETTLYELIEAVGDELEPGEEDFLTVVVLHMLRAGRIEFNAGLRELRDNALCQDSLFSPGVTQRACHQ